MIASMFSDECVREDGTTHCILAHLPYRFEMEVILPPNGYPEEAYPQLYIRSGPNAQLVSVFSQKLHRRMREAIPLGVPMLAMLIPMAQELAEELKDQKQMEDDSRREELAEEEKWLRKNEDIQLSTSIPIWEGDAITDRRSKFIAHMAQVKSLEEVREVIAYLRSIRHIASAAHPTIWAYRFEDDKGVLQQDTDDDGESGASIKMMFLLDQLDVKGYIVVVTRWWGGILLGPDRFKHIMEVTKNLLISIPEREAEIAARGKNPPALD